MSASSGLNRTQTLVHEIGQSIREGNLHPGERLPTERELMATHGVSRTVVREAVSRLQAAGLVESHQGSGTFVLARPSSTHFAVDADDIRTDHDVLELLTFRLGIEIEAAGLAARHRTDHQLAGLLESLDRLRTADRPSAAVEADFQFHLRIALATQNRYFADLIGSLGPTMIAMPRARLDAQDNADVSLARVGSEHDFIVDAIARQDAESARAAMRLHLSNSMARLRHARRDVAAPGPV